MTDNASITLVDSTLPEAEPETTLSLHPSLNIKQRRSLGKRLTRNSVRENLARRKYAKWQRDRYDNQEAGSSAETSLSRLDSTQPERSLSINRASTKSSCAEADGVDLDVEWINVEGEPHSVVDVLYENQRGWFFFGTPYYSEKSLLNLDPAAWLTKNFEMSPVDITNAQPPDPNWEWAWRTWYIDMSYDVDEEGWQYSFSFASRFAWHGTHPWYHSFVRRRRWLRKRVRKGPKGFQRLATDDRSHTHSTLEDFLPSRTVSRNLDPSISLPESASYVSRIRQEQEERISPDEITNPAILLKAVKRATLDREKIEAVKAFVHMGNEELVYLEEKILDIMSMLVFHTSRRQLVEFLVSAVEEISEVTGDESARRRRNNLVRAIDTIYRRYNDLEFWGDVGPEIGAVKGKEPICGSHP
ncbi:meiotically up-regulated 65 protein [Coccidioides immitis RS]|uniref:Meiotically up-regulated 65 protein n=3 Tax=Coccidioides immitis TaxID=5501 RepID=J3KKB3_COCIM|nr:meiotically up-regulated 65 protein [Coccidioides immitis RS]EAS36597.3 meiotically up-regulated 65 protein [Coccidioides immitis RS]KMP01962.1 hypothetical protein CIRG_02101 [Coccidioides immitis RMSCC 2394]KMU88148.1 hypothetical protein CIHG_05319 [Coccidioides immitis H538.4]TPX25308.1 hypothetical protein DIZ76_010759 [Coccidioides immitis]